MAGSGPQGQAAKLGSWEVGQNAKTRYEARRCTTQLKICQRDASRAAQTRIPHEAA